MLRTVVRKIFGSRNDRLVKGYYKTVHQINSLEQDIATLSDDELQQKTIEFRERLKGGETLDDLQMEAFAVVREAGKRTMQMRHYDVQLIGGMVLNDAKIAEMRTGEGKTLVATLVVYLNALLEKGVHVITVNDYLAQRDAKWMSQLYSFLGMSTGVIVSQLDQYQRREAYAADITYGTNNEFGFDYLRDNMIFRKEDCVQRSLYFAVIDEVDSILIDEARTPLIISGASEDSSNLYRELDEIIPELKQQLDENDANDTGDYSIEEKSKQAFLTEVGHQHVEDLLHDTGILPEHQSLYDSSSIAILHHLNAALRAHTLFQKNVDYIVDNNEVIIVDEFTGRTMPGRRWSDGLHQAIEAKERVFIQAENHTMASITFQNYFRLYEKLSGMTGTADTEAFELQEIYGLEVIVIPTHKKMIRTDENDLIYLTAAEKYDAIIEDIKKTAKKNGPSLVGTASIETSELLSNLLKKAKVPHEVLNAKQHEREAHIIENAGRPAAVTIATNMAGRGTDIVLGGNLVAEKQKLGKNPSERKLRILEADWQQRHDQVIHAGGLHIVGTERHESRRVDNQLRGRAARQGDPGSSRFFLSLEDPLMRIFASDRVKAIMKRLGMEKGQAIEAKLVSKSIENAQRKVEAHNFDIRKNLLEYDDVSNDQRKIVYEQRADLLETTDIADTIESICEDVVDDTISRFIPPNSIDEMWNIDGLTKVMAEDFNLPLDIHDWLEKDEQLHEESLRVKIQEVVRDFLTFKEETISSEVMRSMERGVMLQVLDGKWKEHLAAMDYLRQSVGLRGYAQKNPKQEYKREAFEMFEQLLEDIKYEVITTLIKFELTEPEVEEESPELLATPRKVEYTHPEFNDENNSTEASKPESIPEEIPPYRRDGQKIGRNAPCPCGSGKKYKRCHGKLS